MDEDFRVKIALLFIGGLSGLLALAGVLSLSNSTFRNTRQGRDVAFGTLVCAILAGVFLGNASSKPLPSGHEGNLGAVDSR